MRASGILLPISSIPSAYGIGAFSKEAYEFINFLAKAGQSYWQILPLGPTGYGDSPYQSFSTFAGNPYYIDLEALVKAGYITKKQCDSDSFDSKPGFVDYEKIYNSRFKILHMAFLNSSAENNKEFKEFVAKNQYWLEDYALFMAVKEVFDGKSWAEWDEDIKIRNREAIAKYKKECRQNIQFYEFIQFLFAKQWNQLKQYAKEKGVSIIGDIPIYVAFDSADTWANPELFQLDEACVPVGVAGCPPDAFSSTGQLWGNPLYRWEYHKQTGYEWWMKRIAYCYELYDVVRIDHFRGFDEYYAIPYGNPTAEFGKWEKGPGYGLFKVMKEKIGDRPVIAEDLGFLTRSVIELVKKTGYPGMKILQFAFDSREESDYLPHNYTANSVVYTGTHDNDTTLSWFRGLNSKDRSFAKKYLNIKTNHKIEWEFIRSALASVSDTAIIPMQDYLGLSGEARINMPSTLGNNWKWRLLKGQLTEELAEEIFRMNSLYGRTGKA